LTAGRYIGVSAIVLMCQKQNRAVLMKMTLSRLSQSLWLHQAAWRLR